MWIGFAAYLGVLAAAPALGRRVIWATITVAVLGFALAPPLLSHDVYSYVDYARLGVLHGIDPYLRGPAAAPTDPAFAHVTWPHTPSAYGPLFTLASDPLAWLPVSAAVWVLKALAAASVLGGGGARGAPRRVAGSRPAARGGLRRPQPARPRPRGRRRPQRRPGDGARDARGRRRPLRRRGRRRRGSSSRRSRSRSQPPSSPPSRCWDRRGAAALRSAPWSRSRRCSSPATSPSAGTG